MRRRARCLAVAVIVWVAVTCGTAGAQEPVTVRADFIFYGDNTEFRNPFREGETIFGAAVRLTATAPIGERADITFGALMNQRFGSDSAFELVRPVFALRVGNARSSFIFGTLPSSTPGVPPGPDRAGPHKLLPPLQRETLAFDRPYEAGFQWNLAVSRVRHEAWLNWQRLNTRDHRERFDTGITGEVRLTPRVSLPYQLHVVHEGGQQFAVGPVSDSVGAAVGLAASVAAGPIDALCLEIFGLAASDTPDRDHPDRSRDGRGFFGRGSAVVDAWRGHILFWRGRHFITREGDPNYLSLRRNGVVYGGIRDYAETGLTRTFTPATGVLLEASGRLHRVENHYEYSYRILATVDLQWRFRMVPSP